MFLIVTKKVLDSKFEDAKAFLVYLSESNWLRFF